MICFFTLLWIILIEVPLDDKTSKVVRLLTLHYENLSMQYTEIFSPVKIEYFMRKILIFFFFFFCSKHRLGTHNLCFGAKIRKIGIPLHTPVLLYKSGVQRGKHYTDMFS